MYLYGNLSIKNVWKFVVGTVKITIIIIVKEESFQ
jgi:hypothetical protein